MKALTLTQPWASLVAASEKLVETRSWTTRYRGPVAIHAAKGFPASARALCLEEPFAAALRRAGYGGLALAAPAKALPTGRILAVAVLRDVLRVQEALARYVIEGTKEESFGDYSWGRYAWMLSDVVALPAPLEARGALGLWTPEPHVAAYCEGLLDAEELLA